MQIDIDAARIRPEWIMMPREGDTCPYSGLKRKALDFLTRPQERNNFNPPVKSRVLAQGGKGAWRRMIHFQSLMDYIEGLPVELAEPARKIAALAEYRRMPKPKPARRRQRVQEQEVAKA
jgi:hypothetical protein